MSYRRKDRAFMARCCEIADARKGATSSTYTPLCNTPARVNWYMKLCRLLRRKG